MNLLRIPRQSDRIAVRDALERVDLLELRHAHRLPLWRPAQARLFGQSHRPKGLVLLP